MFETKNSKTKQLQKTIKLKANEKSTKYSNKKIQKRNITR